MFGSENLILSSPWPLILIAISAVLDFLEYKFRVKWIFLVANALLCAFAFVAFLSLGAGLADVLLYLLAVVFARLLFTMLERRRSE